MGTICYLKKVRPGPPNSPSLPRVQKMPTSGRTVQALPKPAWSSPRSPARPSLGSQGSRGLHVSPSPRPLGLPGPPARSVFSPQAQRLPRVSAKWPTGVPAPEGPAPAVWTPRPRQAGPPGRGRATPAGRGLHDTAPSCPGADPGPARARPRGRAGAQPARGRGSPLPRLPSLPLPAWPRTPPGRAYPAPRLPRCAPPPAVHARTLTRLQRPWRAPLPVGGCGGLRVTATRVAGDRLGPGLAHSGGGATAVANPQAASLSRPPSSTGAAGGRAGGRR